MELYYYSHKVTTMENFNAYLWKLQSEYIAYT